MPHIPVLLEEVLEHLDLQPNVHIIDATLGEGGHALAILKCTAPNGKVLGIDHDSALEDVVRGKLSAQHIADTRFYFSHGSFENLQEHVRNSDFESVQGIVLDIGLSSRAVDDAQRGFSFQKDGPLDMRFDQTNDTIQTAADIINTWKEKDLIKIFREYGEERWAKTIAGRIVKERKLNSFTRTRELAELINRTIPKKYQQKNIHPATRVFQALRIEVNDELEALRLVLPQALDILMPHGRLAVISFHSLEDRIVKHFFKAESRECICPPEFPICRCEHKARLAIRTRKPIIPTTEERQNNPRSRSAKLRVAEKL